MSIRSKAALLAGVLLTATLSNAASRDNLMRITVLDSETRALPLNDNGVPTNCEQLTFDAYCRSTQTAPILSTLLVQIANEPPFHISCTIESRNSKCAPLPRGATFDAKKEKHGYTVYYVDDKGKPQKEFYKVVDTGKNSLAFAPPAADAAPTAPPLTAPPLTTMATSPRPAAPQATPATARTSQSAALPQPQAAAAPGPGWVRTVNPEKVRCNFGSTPAGAEITIDGQYVGNTPSEIGLTTGTHVVALSLSGFAQWTRQLTVMPASELNVSPVLQKQAQ